MCAMHVKKTKSVSSKRDVPIVFSLIMNGLFRRMQNQNRWGEISSSPRAIFPVFSTI
jgi:hypothetical protein